MAQGSGSARALLAMGIAILCLMTLAQPAFAAIFNVGGGSGWSFNVQNWPRGKSFKAGDILAFNYAKSAHNVVPVSKAAFDSCKPGGAKGSQTGKERMRLRKGHNYFICTFPTHCQSGMKIDVFAS